MKIVFVAVMLTPMIAVADSSVTGEVGIGVGAESFRDAFDNPSPSMGVSVGNWISPRTVAGVRVSVTSMEPEPPMSSVVGFATAEMSRRTFVLAGPSVKYWLDEHVWVGAGAGVAAVFANGDHIRGWGADLRAGYSVGAFSLSAEVTPSYFPTGGPIYYDGIGLQRESASSTGVALLGGYQFK